MLTGTMRVNAKPELIRSLTPHCAECGAETDLMCSIGSGPQWLTQCIECKAQGTITDEEVKNIEDSLVVMGETLFEVIL